MYLSQVLHSEELELIYTYVISFHQILGGELADVFVTNGSSFSLTLFTTWKACSGHSGSVTKTVALSINLWGWGRAMSRMGTHFPGFCNPFVTSVLI